MSIPLDGEATPLERALTDVSDTRSRLRPHLGKVLRLTWDEVPDDWLPFAIQDEGLDELLPFIPPRMILSDEGRLWLRERGSALAILRALGWFGLAAVLHYEPDEDEGFDLFQVELSVSIPATEIPKLVELISLSKPTTDVLGRIFAGDAGHAFRLDHSRLDGIDRLDNWQGVRLPGIDPAIAFGDSVAFEVSVDLAVADHSAHSWRTDEVTLLEGFILDESVLDDAVLEPEVIAIEEQVSSTAAETVDLTQGAWVVSDWPGFAWSDFSIEVFDVDSAV